MLQNTKVILIIVFWNAGRDGLKVKLIIMRFEDAMVVCEDTNGKEYVIQKKKIPEEATERKCNKEGITGKYSMDTRWRIS